MVVTMITKMYMGERWMFSKMFNSKSIYQQVESEKIVISSSDTLCKETN